MFPKDTVLQQMVAESYVGTTLWSAKGKPIGLIAVIGRRPLENTRVAEAVLRMVGIRAAGEMERREAEESLRESETRFRSLVEGAPEAIFVQSEGRFVYVNPAAVKVLGASSPEDLIGKELIERISPEYHDAVRNRIRIQRETGQPVPLMEQEYLRLDGSRVIVETTAMPVRFKGRDGNMVLARDVTDRKRAEAEKARLEEELHQAHKMEAVGLLAGGVAHDFNNQLTVIMGYCEMLLKKTQDPTLTRYATHITSAAERSADLVRQLLAFSRKGHYAPKPVDLHAVLTETLEILKRTVNKKITLRHTFNVADALVIGDSSLLENAFLNLSLNARDAMPDGGELDFTTELVVLDPARIQQLGGEMAPGPFIQVAVRDTGHGMTDDVKMHLFEPFFTTKPVGKGTGLGLAAVYGTVKRHGGGIEVESAVGRGTTFKVYLPVAAPDATAMPADVELHRTPKASASALIMVVDDEELVANLAAEFLTDLGYDVLCMEDGAAAATYYRKHWRKIDLVILDMNMPNMSGAETFAALRAINPNAKVLISSGYSVEDTQVIIRKGAAGSLPKPFRPDQMALMIEQVLRS